MSTIGMGWGHLLFITGVSLFAVFPVVAGPAVVFDDITDTAGIALMGHPSNIRNQFYYREWGLMEVSPCLNANVPFSVKEPFQFAARYVAHDGRLSASDANELFDDFAAATFPKPD